MGRTQSCYNRKCHNLVPLTRKADYCPECQGYVPTTKSISNDTKVAKKTNVAGERITMSLADYEVFKAAQK